MAGLWETWHSADGSEMDTACIITCAANAAVAALHERMPVIIDPADFDVWLDPGSEGAEVLPLMRPCPEDLLELVPVSARLNNAAHEGPEVQAPA